MENAIRTLQNTVRPLAHAEGSSETGIPFVTAYRFTGKTVQMPQTEQPYLYLILDGMLRLHTPSGILDYVPGQYSISKIDTPLSGTVLARSERQDFLSLAVEFTANEVISAVLRLDNALTAQILEERLPEQSICAADGAVLSAICHLFSSMQQAVRSEFLRSIILQEIIYHLLCGSCGKQLLQSIVNIGPAEEIYAANSWIKEHFRSSFTVEELAEQRNMSVSLFHQKFKRAVGMGPLQCQKRLRLTEGRRLMLDEHNNVTEPAAAVGYESLSQFIRDYRKMFGAAPKEDILSLGHRLEK